MIIHNVKDPEFAQYGTVVEGLDDAVREMLQILQNTPLPEKGTSYVPSDEALQNAFCAEVLEKYLFGGLHAQLGWCNGHNTKLNCLEYHRSSEFNASGEDFILLLAKKKDMHQGMLDTSTVRAFLVPAGTLVEIYSDTLHYAPCEKTMEQGFRVLVVLPWGTNTEKPDVESRNREDAMLAAENKWLLAHPESAEAQQGLYIGLKGINIDLSRQ